MPRAKKVKEIKKEEGIPQEQKLEPKIEVSRTPKGTAPVATGSFYALAVEGGAVIVNPNGQTVSKVMRLDKAQTDAQRMNHR